MQIVVLERWGGDTEALAGRLAEVLGKSVVEARGRLAGSGPCVLATFGDLAPAVALADRLRSLGIDDLFVTGGDGEPGAERFVPRDFALGDCALRVAEHQTVYDIPFGEIELLLRGTRIEGHVSRERGSTRQFSLARAVLSGGLMITKKVETVRTRQTEERAAFVEIHAGARPIVVLRESDLRFQSLGAALRPSRSANFQLLAEELRRRAPAAIYDERLQQRSLQVQLLGPGLSPDRYLDLALDVLARTLRRPG